MHWLERKRLIEDWYLLVSSAVQQVGKRRLRWLMFLLLRIEARMRTSIIERIAIVRHADFLHFHTSSLSFPNSMAGVLIEFRCLQGHQEDQ